MVESKFERLTPVYRHDGRHFYFSGLVVGSALSLDGQYMITVVQDPETGAIWVGNQDNLQPSI